MRTIKNELLLKKFEYLKEMLDEKDLGEVEINFAEIDNDLIKRSFQNKFWDGAGGSDEDIHEVFFYNKGILHKDVVRVGEYSGSNYAHSQKIDLPGETLAEGIYRFNQIEPICEDFCIIVKNKGYYNWSGSPYRRWYTVTVYQQKDSNVLDLIEEIIKEIEEEVEKELPKR